MLAFLAITPMASAQTVTFEMIPGAGSANDMSPDGRYVVGDYSTGGTYRLDTLTGDMTTLPPLGLSAVAVSDDGTVILGNIPDPEGIGSQVAAIWNEEDGWESIGHLPDAGACPSRSSAYELSADGMIAVGLSWEGCNGLGFFWTEGSGMLPLEELANGNNRASVLSADGSIIGGFAQGSFSRTPAIWFGATREGTVLDKPDGDALGEIHGMADDGSVLLGEWDGDAIRWTEDGGPEILGDGSTLPGWGGNAMDIADDGTIVGFDFLVGNRIAWIQPGGTGPLVQMTDYIEAHGGTIPEGEALQVCQAITRDGRLICGHSWPMTGGWLVRIAPAIPGDCDEDGDVDLDDYVNFEACVLGPGGGIATDCECSDLDDSGDVDNADFAVFQRNFTG